MKFIVTLLLLLTDSLGASLALRFTYLLRVESGIFTVPLPVELSGPIIILTIYWWTIFLFRGMYRMPIVISRLDEMFNVFKAVFIGILVIFIATFDATQPMAWSRLFLLTYGGLTFVAIGGGRMTVRFWQRRLRNRGIGLWRSVIVGFNDEGKRLNHQFHHWSVWGFEVLGFVEDDPTEGEHLGKRILCNMDELPKLIETSNVQWILIAPEVSVQDSLLKVLDSCSRYKVRFMLIASYYQMVIGLVRTVQIHGLPIVEVMPELVSHTTLLFKRIVDVVVSILALLVFFFFLPLIAFIIKMDSQGPIFYSQIRVGKNGKNYKILKLRSMVTDAEQASGPVWAKKNDPRVTKVGNILRKSHLDEIPQFINVLLGQMSIVGPRPERPHFVDQFRHQIPLYERRLRVRPGITGWAQIRHKYDETIDDVRERAKYDLFYIDHISIGLDIKIIIATAVKVIRRSGQ
ncbi:sugar transferase [Calditrichota bacterium]